jgi:hypothetical protein
MFAAGHPYHLRDVVDRLHIPVKVSAPAAAAAGSAAIRRVDSDTLRSEIGGGL